MSQADFLDMLRVLGIVAIIVALWAIAYMIFGD
jgi:hypothetical protein